ncbi:MAG: L-histidine N(alpha)-methyltransferase [Hyphomicrobium sp.]
MLDLQGAGSEFAAALIAGLSARLKSIPCRFFYDAEGSRLFERITGLPEYYPTRTEISILRAYASQMATLAPPGAVLIEFGSGSSTKTEILLEVMPSLHAYVPIDISQSALDDASARIWVTLPLAHGHARPSVIFPVP